MKRTAQTLIALLLFAPVFFLASCKKDESPKEDYAEIKKGWVTGTWKQKDITLGVSTSVKVGGTKIPLNAGSSMLDDPTINFLLTQMAGANPFAFTRNNIYTFGADGTYKVEGDNDYSIAFSLPVAGKSGTWTSEVYGSVVALFPNKETRDPHWINNINAKELNLAISINLPGLGDVPMNLLLTKQ